MKGVFMNTKTAKAPAVRLHAAYTAIIGSINDPEITRIMADNGYRMPRLEEGKRYYDTVVAANADLIVAKGLKHEAATRAADAKKEAKLAFQSFSHTVKGIFGTAVLASIGLNGQAPLIKANGIFENAAKNQELLVKLAECGYDAAKLQSEHDKISAYIQANDEYESVVVRTLSVESDRNQKLAALESWLAPYLEAAEVVLRENNGLKKKIGIAERSVETPIAKMA
jgi:hypothetical protein